jgi:hypothetical protein
VVPGVGTLWAGAGAVALLPGFIWLGSPSVPWRLQPASDRVKTMARAAIGMNENFIWASRVGNARFSEPGPRAGSDAPRGASTK